MKDSFDRLDYYFETEWGTGETLQAAVLDLIRSGGNPNSVDRDGVSALNYTVKNGDDFKATCMLLLAGADPTFIDELGQNTLHIAAEVGASWLVETLVQTKKMDINLPGFAGMTPLMRAAEEGWDDTFFLCLRLGADPTLLNAYQMSILHLASCGSRRGTIPILEYCLSECHLPINTPDANGDRPLDHAEKWGCEEIWDWLVAHRADSVQRD
jgi:ankyrin repeat protein